MSFSSIGEICDEFHLEYTLDKDVLMKQLTHMQATIHPDTSDTVEGTDNELFTRLSEAKEYLRSKNDAMIPLSELREIASILREKDIISDVQKSERDLLSTLNDNIQMLRKAYMPRRITIGGVIAVVTFIWSFPSTITEHPLFSIYFENLTINDKQLFFTEFFILWAATLLISVLVLINTYTQENQQKNLLHRYENENYQYHLFTSFIESYDGDKFTQKDIEHVIKDDIRNQIKYLFPRWKRYLMRPLGLYHSRFFINIERSVVPRIAETIILRAVEKGIIKKTNDKTWYDTYIIC